MSYHQKPQHNLPRVILQAVIMMAIGIFLFFAWKHELVGIIIGCTGFLVFLLSLFVRPVVRGMVWLQKKVMLLISTIMTWVLLVPCFYLCFLPGRFIQLLTGKDPLTRKFKTDMTSYWEPYDGSFDIEQSRRQF